jgi:hypothetical protein
MIISNVRDEVVLPTEPHAPTSLTSCCSLPPSLLLVCSMVRTPVPLPSLILMSFYPSSISLIYRVAQISSNVELALSR